ncbi:hypothetical protein [Pseudomonas sp. SCB32]|uniref:hypothetical protein n=1 Tax=Pseudomonas sp. SCB32 TaxID=2653853 RepID=UPI001265998F|nr:hypothetical protein [Pseudomonas sp. SCB32]
MSIFDLLLAAKDEYRRWRDGPPVSQPMQRQSRLQPLTPPASPPSPAPSAAPAPATPQPASDLAAVRSWSHPFGSKADPIQQLTHLASAQAGYFPIGRNGLWHGGVHFDAGTAGAVRPEGQSYVRCLADGEVIAYRIPEKTPETTFHPAPGKTKPVPFASGFVLVRHRLEAPKIEGKGTPPSLIFYSLYMHLADWASYQADIRRERPAFWPESPQLRVKAANKDPRLNHPDELGLNLRHLPSHGKIIGFLPHGATVTVSGTGDYRKVEGIKGPVDLQNPDGSLRGYVSQSGLQASGGGYRVISNELKVFTDGNAASAQIFKLPKGTELTLSSEGAFCKLESVTQYVHFTSLERVRTPERGKVVVLDRPVPIKAGQLIGHLGPYQDCRDEHSQEKLHLEVFACENVETFFKNSREWAKDLPEKEKTWLKLEKGTKAVTHQDSYSTATPPNFSHDHSLSSAPLLLPRSMLEGLAKDRKIKVPANEHSRAKTWYRLENLILGADRKVLPDVWVCDEEGTTPSPWVSPWSWDGYEVIYNNDPPQNALSYFLFNLGDYFNEQELDQWKPLADASDKGPVRQRLFDIIDANRDGKIEAQEVQLALGIPAYAQSISQLVIHYESEWYYQKRKWDALDKVLGHTGSTPILNWVAEKTRIKELSWWGEVAERGILTRGGEAYFLHPLWLNGVFLTECACGRDITKEELKKISPGTSDDVIDANLSSINQGFNQFHITTCRQKAHFLAQVLHESDKLYATREYGGESKSYAPWFGRGFLQLTLEENYKNYGVYIGEDVTSSDTARDKLTKPPHSALSAFWFYAEHKKLIGISEHDDLNMITARINGGFNGYNDRLKYFKSASMVLGGAHLSKLEASGQFPFDTSAIYKNKIYSLAWGIWHDPVRTEHGVTKDRHKALAGYKQAKVLLQSSPMDPATPNKKIYGIRYIDVQGFVDQRIAALTLE